MKRAKSNELRKIIGLSALALTLAVTAFIGSNNLVFAAATQPETIPMTNNIKISQMSANTAPDGYQAPKLTIVWNDMDGYADAQPKAGAMGYEEAAQIGAQYIGEVFGESIDGKTVEMTYVAWPFSSKTYWNGTVVNSKDDLTPPQIMEEGDPIPDISEASAYEDPTIFSFTIDAVTGEWVMISENQPAPQRGEGLGKTVTRAELETLMKQPPAQLGEYIAIAKEFAEKHFNRSKVSGAEFDSLYFQYNSKSLSTGNDTAEILEKGTTISIKVTDDTGRAALVSINMDTNKAFALDTKDSDHIPGYNHEGIYDGV